MTRTQIISAINNWGAIRTDDQDLINILEQGNCFEFEFPSYGSDSRYIHAYPGIHNDKLVFIMISSDYDDENYDADFDQYVTVCPITSGTGSAPISTAISSTGANRITQTDAQDRIDDWISDFRTWVPQQVLTTDGIFQAFAVPVDSFEVEKSQVYLGLHEENTRDIAELVVVNRTSSTTYYDDYVQPVPPFNPVITKQSFYLLSL